MSSTTTTSIRNILPTSVNGAKELKEYIDRTNSLIQAIRGEFEKDLKQDRANVERPNTFLGSRNISCEMCQVAHRDYVYYETALPQQSAFLQAEQIVLDAIGALEHLRKMLVTNKQQKRTMLRNIRRSIASERSALALPPTAQQSSSSSSSSQSLTEPLFDCLLEYEGPAIKGLKQLGEQLKQNHRTIARNILQQAQPILIAMRTRGVLAYKLAAENTIGKIIHHAEKCRTFIAQSRYLACIEYCASAWWMETQKDPMDHSPYYVRALLEGESTPSSFSESYAVQRPVSVFGETAQQIVIEVQSANMSSFDGSSKMMEVVFSEHLDQELAETILTEEAVRAFEAEELPTSYHRHYGTIFSTPPPPAADSSSVRNNDNDNDDDNDNDNDDDNESDDEEWEAAAAAAAMRMEWDD
jgi:hypothetical protein